MDNQIESNSIQDSSQVKPIEPTREEMEKELRTEMWLDKIIELLQ